MILLPQAMIEATNRVFKSKGQTFYRDGVPLEKGVVLTEKRITRNLKLY